MSEPVGDIPPRPERRPLTDPIGVRILGSIDPLTLSREEFFRSSDLLFHGSEKPLQFSPSYDYSSKTYIDDSLGGQTLGLGFYTTDSLEVAENYSRERQGKPNAEPNVTILFPHHAKMLDLRSAEAPDLNAPVPQELLDKWYEFFKKYLATRPEDSKKHWGTNFLVSNIEDDYFQFLERARELQKQITLRVMLDTAPDPDLHGHNYPHPPYMKTFSDFMTTEGYDGLIYVEGGEGPKAENHNSFIFFNLNKIDTFDGWQEKSRGAGN